MGEGGSRIHRGPDRTSLGDASFRRYFRLTRGTDSYIVMDAPPDKEALGPYRQRRANAEGVWV